MTNDPWGQAPGSGGAGPDRDKTRPQWSPHSEDGAQDQQPYAQYQQPYAQYQYAQYPGPYAQAGYPGRAQIQPSNGLGTASLVLGITSIVFCWWGLFSLAQVVLAIVFGAIGISRANQGATGKGLAVAGLICGVVGFAAYCFVGLVTLGVGFII